MYCHGVKPLAVKVSAIQNFPQPTTQTKLREFLGLVNFYRRFIPRCSHILQPLTELLTNAGKKSAPLAWNDQATASFEQVKTALANATLLAHPKPRDANQYDFIIFSTIKRGKYDNTTFHRKPTN